MLKIKIITIGKLKENYLKDAQAEYLKRLSAYSSPEVIELAEEKLPQNPSLAQIEQGLMKEADRIKKEIPNGAYVYSLCIEGSERSSEKLADEIKNIGISGRSTIVFIIGSSFGLDDEIKKLSSSRLSFSKMTFPHQLARIMLLEQVYRAFSINNNSKYHK